MTYEYECGKCGGTTDESFRMGEAAKTVKCSVCGSRAKRIFSSPAIEINGGIERKSTFGEDMRKRNENAGRRMKGQKAPVKTVAYDYGGGDIREAWKT